MSYRIIEIDGIKVDSNTQRFPVEVYPEPHAINGNLHTGMLDDNQIPQNIMRDSEHQNDPHTMIIDGRDVSVDGSKLDTIETGAEVNNLTDQQAASLVSGAQSNWHTHDDWYYRKTQLQTGGESSVHWDNITNTPATYPPSTHNHDNLYYTETELDDGVLDSRYYTETEIQQLYYSKTQLEGGQLDTRYYTESEIDLSFANYYTKTELDDGQLDIRYFTEAEIVANYYNKSELNAGQLDTRYYTETEVDNIISNYYTETELDNGQLDDRYYTEGEVDTKFGSYFTKTEHS